MKILTPGFAFLLSIAFVACTEYKPVKDSATSKSQSAEQPAAAVDPLEMGRKLYEQNCMVCHKENGTGGKVTVEGKSLKVDDLTSEKRKGYSDEKIEEIIFNGVEDDGMPAFKEKLSEAQIREVVKYIRVGLQKMAPPPVVSPGRY